MAPNKRKQDDGLGGSLVEFVKTIVTAGIIVRLPFSVPSHPLLEARLGGPRG